MRRLLLLAAPILLLAAPLLGLAAAPADAPLPIQPGRWTLVVSEAPAQPPHLEAGIDECSGSPCLRVGPWRAGRWSARYDFKEAIPSASGAVRGQFRTSGLYPKQPAVRVQWFDRSSAALSNRYYSLPAAESWRDFEIPVRAAPAGAASLRLGFGLHEHAEGAVWFRDLRFSPETAPLAFPGKQGLTRPAPPPPLTPATYSRVTQYRGAWWFVDPAGRPFFSLGAVPPYNPTAVPESEAADHLRRLGFNSLAAGASLTRWTAFNNLALERGEKPFHQFRTIEVRVGAGYDALVDRQGRNPGASQTQAAAIGGFNHAFPDPFDPRWEADVRRQVREAAALVRGKPYFTAWFAGNERAHSEIHRYVYAPGSAQALLAFLEKRYSGGIQTLNNTWGGDPFSSFAQILERKPEPSLRQGPLYEDFRSFSREILRRYNQTILRIVREEDPGRLVASNRFMAGERRDVFENLDLYRDFDFIAVNLYPLNLTPGLAPDDISFLETVHRLTGKPLLIGEWSVPALDSGLYSNPQRLDWSFPQAVPTQTDRASQAAQILAAFYNLPFVAGAHWFAWADFNTATRQANRGLFQSTGEPWPALQESLANLHRRIEARR